MTNSESTGQEGEKWWSSWGSAHNKTCRNRNALFATPQQVLDYTNQNTTSNSSETPIIYWSLPDRHQITEWRYSDNEKNEEMVEKALRAYNNELSGNFATPEKQLAETPPPLTPSTPPPLTPSMFQYVTQTVAATLTPLVGVLTPKKPKVPSYAGQEQDDALTGAVSSKYEEEDDWQAFSPDNQTSSNVGLNSWDLPIWNSYLTKICLEIVHKVLEEQYTSTSTGFPTILTRHKTQNSEGDDGHCWRDWLRSVCLNEASRDSTLLANLSRLEIDFLLQCASEKGWLTIISAGSVEGQKHDLVILERRSEDNAEAELYQQVLASYHQLSKAQQALEIRREDWSKKSDKCLEHTMQERKRGRDGLTYYKMHKLFLERLKQTEIQLLNQEQALHLLVSSWHQRQVVDALGAYSDAMKAISGSCLYEQDDMAQLLDSYQDDMEHVTSVQNSITSNTLGSLPIDEDELIKELEGLTLRDKNETKSPKRGSIELPEPPRFRVQPGSNIPNKPSQSLRKANAKERNSNEKLLVAE